MTLCNMAIEAGARAGLVGVDEITLDYVLGRPFSPQGALWNSALEYWSTLVTDDGALFDSKIELDASLLGPQVSWGTSPEMVLPVGGAVPNPDLISDPVKCEATRLSLDYMGLRADQPITDIALDRIFIGSCTNARIEDLRAAAKVLKGRKISKRIKEAIAVPGSGLVKKQAEKEGLADIFIDSGFQWRDAGCSMCLAMNPDKLVGNQLCASSSNRNFKGRQGSPTGRTVLMSPLMVAAAAIKGHVADAREVFDV